MRKNENPFYGQRQLLNLIKLAKGMSMAQAYTLCKSVFSSLSDKIMIEVFHIICFSQGDITNRYHNIFKGNTHEDLKQGGEANVNFWLGYLLFLLDKPKLFVKALPLIVEYVGLRELTTYQVRTKKKTNKITGTWGILNKIIEVPLAYEGLLNQLVKMANGTDFQKYQVAKFISIPRFSKRQGDRKLQKETIAKMKCYRRLIEDLSARMNWAIVQKEDYVRYEGFINWRKPINEKFEYFLLSSGKIKTFDKEKFLNFLNSIPSSARFNLRRTLLTEDNVAKEKWSDTNLPNWFIEWENFKKNAQQEQRVLELKAKTTGLSVVEKQKLEKVKKDAKVTTGAFNLVDAMGDIIRKKASDVTIHSVMDKITFNVPVLPCIDRSGSMGWNSSNGIKTLDYAKLFTTLILLKNPVDENIFFTFGSDATVYHSGENEGTVAKNRFMKQKAVKVKGLVDSTKPFSYNYKNVSKLISCPDGSTNIHSIPEAMKIWVDSASDEIEKLYRKEIIQQYPVFLFISDGEFNNTNSVMRSIRQFQMSMKQWFNHEPLLVLWDVKDGLHKVDLSDLENVIHYTGVNLSTINQIFTKIHDLDIVDIYTVLNSLHQSKRYELIKNLV